MQLEQTTNNFQKIIIFTKFLKFNYYIAAQIKHKQMIKKLRILKIDFENPIRAYEIGKFRGAVIQNAGKEHILFHNHVGEDFRHSYPLIQYKCISDKAAVICIEEGVDEIHHFFESNTRKFILEDKETELKVKHLGVNSFTMQVWDRKFPYSIINWLALNSENYSEFNKIEGLAQRCQFLESLLTANIISFAKGIDWYIEKEVSVTVQNIDKIGTIKYKNIQMQSFNLKFSTNVFLPDFIGLGKGASTGFGTVKQIKGK